MIDIAYKHKAALQTKYIETVDGNPYYKYWNFGSYWDHEGKLGSEDSDLHAIQRVSIVNGELLGYFTVRADRATMEGYSVALLSFNPGKINLAFARDAISFIESLFDDYGMKVLRFVVVDGNPAKSLYDRWVGNHYGRYVGTRVIFCRTTTEIPDFAKYIPLTLAKIVDDAETPFLSETIGNKIIGIEWNERAKGTSILVPTTFANALHFLCNWMHLKL